LLLVKNARQQIGLAARRIGRKCGGEKENIPKEERLALPFRGLIVA
jgi:hypothetical protein